MSDGVVVSLSPSRSKKGSAPPQMETVRAKYVIGCDGAHSWTRRNLGIKMQGEQTSEYDVDSDPEMNASTEDKVQTTFGVYWTWFL
jgi:2-polyprenyl-6-methoxyphenol hydroxylase-like FAD-dependent oxidoreductase